MKKLFLALACMMAVSPFAAPAQEGWQITATDYDSEPYYGTVVANGGIGILPWKDPFSVRNIVLNHVFDTSKPMDISTPLHGINPFNLAVKINGTQIAPDNISDWRQTIDMRNAVHITEFKVKGLAEVKCEIRALRNMPYCGTVSVDVKALRNIAVEALDSISLPRMYQAPTDVNMHQNVDGQNVKIIRRSAPSKHRNQIVSASAAFISNDDSTFETSLENNLISFSKDLKKGSSFGFTLIGSVVSGRDFLDPYNESDRQVSYAAKEGMSRTIAGHRRLWDQMWEGDIIIEGDPEAQQAVRFSLYNLYSSARKGSGLSIPPFGLSSRGYNGHVFWDTELWMYPPMLFLNQGIARSMMDYRTNRLDAACRKAMAYGYDGAMFPWESDDAGEEACPTWALTGGFEHHITADIGIAAWNYYRMTGDKRWLLEKGFPLMEKVADFWVSRAEKNPDGTYSVRNVVCADEYAIGVDDNAFTNAAAICALDAAVKAANECGVPAPKKWAEVASSLRIPVSSDGVTLEYEGYAGHATKQADVNLLGYPLGVITDPDQLRRDLAYYESKIDPKGPAMSFAVLAIQHARLGEGEKAYELFTRSFKPNQLPPFGVVSEGAGGSNPYFTTGAGGFLQAVINGFCGLELTDEGVVQLPSALPRHWKKVTVKGVGPDRRTYERVNRK